MMFMSGYSGPRVIMMGSHGRKYLDFWIFALTGVKGSHSLPPTSTIYFQSVLGGSEAMVDAKLPIIICTLLRTAVYN